MDLKTENLELKEKNNLLKIALNKVIENQNDFREYLDKHLEKNASGCYLWRLSKTLTLPDVNPILLD